MTNVTIRGIDDTVYLQFSAEATLRGISIGDLTTQAMTAFLDQTRGPIYRIWNLEELVITANDLDSIDGVVNISNIERLEFEKDVTWEKIKDRIQIIENVEKLIIPKSISKFQILTKTKNIESIKTV
jgi:hypothetical protein